jgi:hypothetical protein
MEIFQKASLYKTKNTIEIYLKFMKRKYFEKQLLTWRKTSRRVPKNVLCTFFLIYNFENTYI